MGDGSTGSLEEIPEPDEPKCDRIGRHRQEGVTCWLPLHTPSDDHRVGTAELGRPGRQWAPAGQQ